MHRFVAAMGVALALALVGTSACTSAPKTALEPSDTGVHSLAHMRRDTIYLERGVEVKVGTYFRDALRGQITDATAFTSTNPSVVTVAAGMLRTLEPGVATLNASAPLGPLHVRVMTRRQAVNRTIVEACLNENEPPYAAPDPITTDVSTIHEYSDCQRLIDGKRYGPLVGIFAHASLESTPTGDLAARGFLAALIVNFGAKGPLAYAPLGIQPGTSCLMLRKVSNEWQAVILPQVPAFTTGAYGSCPNSMSWTSAAAASRSVSLEVHPQHGVDPFGKSIVPPTARWDWDEEGRQNYIGVKCDERTWCEIGPTGFRSSPQKFESSTGQPLIKGYYDQQYLATKDATEPSGVFGTLMPGTDPLPPLPWTRWQHTQHLDAKPDRSINPIVSGSYAGYIRMLKLDHHGLPLPFVPWHADGAMSLLSIDQSNDYDVRINGAKDSSWRVVYHAHPDAMKYRIARWRWLDKDESTWESCPPDGCCELMGLEQLQ